MSDISETEKRIQQRAKQRFDKEWGGLVEFLVKHPIARRLKFTVDGKEINFAHQNHQAEEVIPSFQDRLAIPNNLPAVRKKLIQEYEKAEVDELYSKLESINYLFQQQ